MVARPVDLDKLIVARDKAAFFMWTKTGEILYSVTPKCCMGKSAAGSLIGHNIANFLEKRELSHALSNLNYVIRNRKTVRHDFNMLHEGRIVNRLIRLFPVLKKNIACGFIEVLNSIVK